MTEQLTCAACEIGVSWPGVEPVLPAVEERSLNSWTFREVPFLILWSKGKGHIIISWLPVLTCRGGVEGKGENWIYQSPNLFTSISSEAPRKCACSSNRNEHLSPCILPWRCSLSQPMPLYGRILLIILILNSSPVSATLWTCNLCCCCLATKSCPVLCDPMDSRLLCPPLSPGVCSNWCPLSQ